MYRISVLLFVCLAALAGCGDSGSSPSDDPECTPGEVKNCVTTCDTVGNQQCDTAGYLSQTCLPPQETCNNNLDDDCDGLVDEGCVTCQPTGAELCGNNIDDNCDGQVDEGCVCTGTQQEECIYKKGECSAIGARTCANGQWGQCFPPEETCNEEDDDCDGQVDEGLNCGGDDKCQTGDKDTCLTTCDSIGQKECINGTWTDCIPPLEVCNGVDDDCDGIKDDVQGGCNCADGQTQLCGTSTGVCEQGTQTCTAGQWSDCANGYIGPSDEVCDSLDNDCNGAVDDKPGGCKCNDGATQPCGTDTGECSKGIQTCITGIWSECGGQGYNAATDEKCNGLDDDCDGQVDENNPEGGIMACGTPNFSQGGTKNPPCQAGVMNCKNGQLTCDGGIDPTPEFCDEIDNDCDGQVDEGITGDQYEANETCPKAADLAIVLENQGKMVFQGTMFPDGDTDWYVVVADELSGFCLPGSDEGPYTFTVKLKDIPAGSDYDLCVWPHDENGMPDALQDAAQTCADLPDEGPCEELGIWESDNTPEEISFSWDGECFKDDSVVFYIKVVNYFFNGAFDCKPYTLELEMKGN